MEFQNKQHYRKATAQCFSVGTQIKRSIVGILAAEVKGTWRIWSKTGKGLYETR
jgi:hypothetical protein